VNTTLERAYKYWPVILDDSAARKYTSSILYHGYDFKDYEKIAALHKRYPDLPLWMTEVCHAYNAGTPKSMVLTPASCDAFLWNSARCRGTRKRGANAAFLGLHEAVCMAGGSVTDVVAVDEALMALAAADPRRSQVVE